jgi:dihydrofolate reductase
VELVAINHITLDGVMQAPGRPDEDPRRGFRHGGWAATRSDQTTIEATGAWMGRAGRGLLLGRRSYEGMLGAWNERGGPFRDALNAAPKFVVSSDPSTTLQWPNSTVVAGDVPAAVADLKHGFPGDLVIMGSGQLIRTLLPHRLIDIYLLMIHPIVLGSGERLFGPADQVTELELVTATTTAAGVVITTYRPS